MSANSKLTAIADKIRALLGITNTMGLDAMNSNLNTAVSEVDTQAELINQLKEKLNNKLGRMPYVEWRSYTPTSDSKTATFYDVAYTPSMFYITPDRNITLSSSAYVICVDYVADSGIYGVYSNRATATVTYGFTWDYNNGTLTVTAPSGSFRSGVEYWLGYI